MIVVRQPPSDELKQRMQQIRPDDARSYLEDHGWKVMPYSRPDSWMLECPEKTLEGEPVYDYFPAKDTFSDYGRCVEELVRMLSQFELRPQEDIVAEILAQGNGQQK